MESCQWQQHDGSRGYYAKWNKSDRKRQLPPDLTYPRNPKKKQTKQNENTYEKKEKRMIARREGGWWVKYVQRIKRHKPSVT